MAMDKELVENRAMDEKLMENSVMDAKIHSKVVMDLFIFQIGGWNELQPIDPVIGEIR